ncbi:MAG: hypothetical protein ACYSWU_17790 [Planctomycetota bacterium]|jgi:hypothetical protein
MQPETPGQSPFAPQGFTRTPPLTPEQPEPPRLGILHLMVLTACVAAYMGPVRALEEPIDLLEEGTRPFWVTTGSLYGIGSGAALAGLVLVAARRYRGLSFPVHPGEYLLVVMGFGVLLHWMALALAWLITSFGDPRFGLPSFHGILYLFPFAFYALCFLWAAIRAKSRRWRVLFLAIPTSYVVSFLFLCGGARLLPIANSAPPLLITVVLIVVIVRDHFEGKRYPWTHWFGVGTRLWLDVGAFGVSVWYELFERTVPLDP